MKESGIGEVESSAQFSLLARVCVTEMIRRESLRIRAIADNCYARGDYVYGRIIAFRIARLSCPRLRDYWLIFKRFPCASAKHQARFIGPRIVLTSNRHIFPRHFNRHLRICLLRILLHAGTYL